jgi:catechol 2,3-dioxygenase-like lactoylglutathione lyase family enzyme
MQERSKGIGRYAVALFLVLTGAVAAQTPAPPDYAGFDHLTLEVTDLERARDFYTRLFGFNVWQAKAGAEQYLVLGNTYLNLHAGEQPGVRQVGIGVHDFTSTGLTQYLEREGLRGHEALGGQALGVDDGDGLRTLLLDAKSWERVRAAASAVSAPTAAPAPVFKPLRLDEVGLSVRNLEVDSLFYARLLARNSVLQAGSLWYSFGNARLRLTQTPVGQHPGVGYFSILIANTDLEAAANAVFAAGGIIETLFPNGFSFWDPDGVRVVVHTSPMF